MPAGRRSEKAPFARAGAGLGLAKNNGRRARICVIQRRDRAYRLSTLPAMVGSPTTRSLRQGRAAERKRKFHSGSQDEAHALRFRQSPAPTISLSNTRSAATGGLIEEDARPSTSSWILGRGRENDEALRAAKVLRKRRATAGARLDGTSDRRGWRSMRRGLYGHCQRAPSGAWQKARSRRG